MLPIRLMWRRTDVSVTETAAARDAEAAVKAGIHVLSWGAPESNMA
jgi:hypothetical protein